MITSLKPSIFLFLAIIVIISFFGSAIAVVNITRILGGNPEFSVFSDYLTQTNVSDQINRRQTITVLVVDNAAASPALKGKPISVVRDVLAAHVILDYFGQPKLRRLVLRQRSTLLTTLFQASGRAAGLQGFLNVSTSPDGSGVAFGSGVKNSPLVATLVGPVVARPYVISVVQVSALIFPTGVDPNPSPPPVPAIAPPPPPQQVAEEVGSPVEAPPLDDEQAAPVAEAPAADEPEIGDDLAKSPAEKDVDADVLEGSGSGSVGIQLGKMIIGLLLCFVAM